MPSIFNALLNAGLLACFWTVLGLAVTAILLPREIALPIAPALGWSIHSAAVLPVFIVVGMSQATVIAVNAACFGVAGFSLYASRSKLSAIQSNLRWLSPAFVGAGILAFAVMAAVLPKISSEGVALAGPIFDHSKIAIIDEIVRLGVPPANPFFGEVGGPSRLSYYYLWHFSAAEFALMSGSSGWSADTSLTWFTAFASLSLMIGFAAWLTERSSAAIWVLVLAATASIRPFLSLAIGKSNAYAVTGWPSGFGGWLFQIEWAPQHMASANCAVIAIFLLAQPAFMAGALGLVTFSLLATACFQSSIWIGGVTFPLAIILVGLMLLKNIEPAARWRFSARLLVAAWLAIALSAPMLYDLVLSIETRAVSDPIAISSLSILGEETPEVFRRFLDVPVYWTIFLIIELPAYYLAGIISAAVLARDQAMTSDRKIAVIIFALVIIVSLAVGGFLISRLAVNNDLGWRGVLPAVILLIIFSSTGLSRYTKKCVSITFALQFALVGLGLIAGSMSIYGNFHAEPTNSSKAFSHSSEMWEAVRRHSAKDDRVANNPQFLADMTDWPINISWAVLANRRSCYAGADFVLPFTQLTADRRKEVDALFLRIFSGNASADDVRQLSARFNCSVVVITSMDGAWNTDQFVSSSVYRLVETNKTQWRIYTSNKNER